MRHVTASLIALLLLASAAVAQHVPSASVDGLNITIDADIAWFDHTLPTPTGAVLEQGTQIGPGEFVYASSDGSSPIVVRVPQGDYTVHAMGFPASRLNPNREFRTLTLSVTPSRQDLINWAYTRLFEARDDFVQATSELVALVPTAEEVGAALANFTASP